jgi:hypothetical protein
MHSAPDDDARTPPGCPIRVRLAHRSLAAPQARFAALRALLRPLAPLGIHPAPFLAWLASLRLTTYSSDGTYPFPDTHASRAKLRDPLFEERDRRSRRFECAVKRCERRKPSRTTIRGGRLSTLPCVHARPSNPVICRGSCVVRLRTRRGTLILGSASRVDAFSASPCWTWLSGSGGGPPTGPPAVQPLRSSRTGSDSPQRSCARDG